MCLRNNLTVDWQLLLAEKNTSYLCLAISGRDRCLIGRYGNLKLLLIFMNDKSIFIVNEVFVGSREAWKSCTRNGLAVEKVS